VKIELLALFAYNEFGQNEKYFKTYFCLQKNILNTIRKSLNNDQF